MDLMTILLIVIFVVLIFFMFRNNKKRQKAQAELQDSAGIGAEIMTNYGLYGIIRDIDEAENIVIIETTPGVLIKIHRQTITKVVTPSEPVLENGSDVDDLEPLEDENGRPLYGQREESAADDAVADDGSDSKDGADSESDEAEEAPDHDAAQNDGEKNK